MENEEERLGNARQNYDAKFSCPDGYAQIRLSTGGKVGAPPVFHIRNFSIEEVMELNATPEQDRLIKLIKILQELIYEKDVDIKLFHQKEVIELMLLMYEYFFTDVFANQVWIPTEEDWKFLEEESGGKNTEDFRRKKQALDTGMWKPTFDLNIEKDIKYFDIAPDFKSDVKLEGNRGFTATFSLPRFGDVVILKSFAESMFKEKDKQFARITEMVKFRQDAEERLRNGENINMAQIPTIPKAEEDKLREYEMEKTLFMIRATVAMYLVEFNGEPLRDVPIEKKLKLAQDPRLDFASFTQVQEKFDSLEFGIKEEITAFDPIMNKIVTRKYPFRIDTILAAFGTTRPSKITLTFV
jgi:hypothetical protein